MKHIQGGNYSNHNDPKGSQFHVDTAPRDGTSTRVALQCENNIFRYACKTF